MIQSSSTDQKNLGMSMKIERSTVDQVKNRLSMIKKKKEEKERVEEFGMSSCSTVSSSCTAAMQR